MKSLSLLYNPSKTHQRFLCEEVFPVAVQRNILDANLQPHQSSKQQASVLH